MRAIVIVPEWQQPRLVWVSLVRTIITIFWGFLFFFDGCCCYCCCYSPSRILLLLLLFMLEFECTSRSLIIIWKIFGEVHNLSYRVNQVARRMRSAAIISYPQFHSTQHSTSHLTFFQLFHHLRHHLFLFFLFLPQSSEARGTPRTSSSS